MRRSDQVTAGVARVFAADEGPLELLLDEAAGIIGRAEGDMCLIGARANGSAVFGPVGLYHHDPERLSRINDTPGFVWPVSKRAALVMASGKPFIADDSSVRTSLPTGLDLPWRDVLQESGTFPHVMMAIRFGGDSVGMIVVARKAAKSYSATDVERLQGSVDVLAVALRDSYLRTAGSNADDVVPQVSRSNVASLSQRERQIIVLVARGLTSAEVARELNLSTRTVEWYRARVLEKLGHPTREDLVALGRSLG